MNTLGSRPLPGRGKSNEPLVLKGRWLGGSYQARKVRPACCPRFNAVPCLFSGEIQTQERDESRAAAEALTVPEDAGRPAVSSPAPPSNANQHSDFHHPPVPQPLSEEVNTVGGREITQLTDGQEATDLEEVPREAPTEEQRCEPQPSPSSLSQEECIVTLQDHLPSMQPEVKATSTGGDRGISEGGDTRSTVQT